MKRSLDMQICVHFQMNISRLYDIYSQSSHLYMSYEIKR